LRPTGKQLIEAKIGSQFREDDMETTKEIPIGVPFKLAEEIVGLERASGRALFMEWRGEGPPARIDGYTVGAPLLVSEPPHAGEMHPDADELLYLVSGRVRVRLELQDGNREIHLGQDQALIVPRGVWHKIFIEEPGRLVHVTPGPGGEHRPLTEAAQ
jgi:mannose-6-phosphate isomerase-like protein (cupin superfamily)